MDPPEIVQCQNGLPLQAQAVSGGNGEGTNASWAALLLAVTLGDGQVFSIRTRVIGDNRATGAGKKQSGQQSGLRLIVQSYSPGNLNSSWIPLGGAKPIGSLQRAVTLDELERGVAVELVHPGGTLEEASPVVVAWVEPGVPDLEFDGRKARPRAGVWFGTGERGNREHGILVLLKPTAA